MVLSGVAAHDEDHVGIRNVGPAVSHGSPAKRGGQTGHRGAVSKTGLMFVGENAEAEAEFAQQKVNFCRVGTAADQSDAG